MVIFYLTLVSVNVTWSENHGALRLVELDVSRRDIVKFSLISHIILPLLPSSSLLMISLYSDATGFACRIDLIIFLCRPVDIISSMLEAVRGEGV